MDTNRTQITRNTVINLAGALAAIPIALVTIPLYLDVVGAERYGVLALAWLFLGYAAVFDLGFGRAAANRIARLGAAAPQDRRRVFWTAATLNATLGVAGGLLLLVGGYVLFGRALGLPSELRDEAVAGLPFLAAAVPFLVVSSGCRAVLEGLERFVPANALDVLTIAAYQLVPLMLAYAGGSNLTLLLAGIATAPVAGAAFGLLACAIGLRPVGRPGVDPAIARSLARYGGWVTVTGVLIPLLTMLDRLVIGAVSGARAVAYYTVPFNLVARLGIVPMSLSRALFPRFSALPAREANAVGRRALLGLVSVLTPIVVAGILLVEPFLRVWVGASFADVSAPVGQIILLGVWVNALAFVPHTLLEGQRRPDLPAKLHLLELPPYVFALWVGLELGGIEGVAWAWVARAAANAVLLLRISGLLDRHGTAIVPPAALVLLSTLTATSSVLERPWRIALGCAFVVAAAAWAWVRLPTPWKRGLGRRRSGRPAPGEQGGP